MTNQQIYNEVYKKLRKTFLATPAINDGFSAYHLCGRQEIANMRAQRLHLFAPLSISDKDLVLNGGDEKPCQMVIGRYMTEEFVMNRRKVFPESVNMESLPFYMEVVASQEHVYDTRVFTYEETIKAIARDFSKEAIAHTIGCVKDVRENILFNALKKIQHIDAIEIVRTEKEPLCMANLPESELNPKEDGKNHLYEGYRAIMYSFPTIEQRKEANSTLLKLERFAGGEGKN